jgi:hypothetical protein
VSEHLLGCAKRISDRAELVLARVPEARELSNAYRDLAAALMAEQREPRER